MEQHIRLLDCTLRDGGHLNEGKFGEDTIKGTIDCLINANIDIVEVGFLWDKAFDINTSRYYSIEDVKRILPNEYKNSKISVMADFIDLNHLEPYDGTVEYIRLIFKRNRINWAISTAETMMSRGYKCFLNPVNCNVYTDEEYLEVIQRVNQLKPYAFSMVDTFGALNVDEATRRYLLIENNLDPSITIGLHLHENMGLATSIAQKIAEIASPKRNIVIDGSISGMGRDPGNLQMEIIADYMNEHWGKDYDLPYLYDALEKWIMPIKDKFPWGFSVPYALSGKYKIHRTYAEFLKNKSDISLRDIDVIFRNFDRSEVELYNEKYIDEVYKKYISEKS